MSYHNYQMAELNTILSRLRKEGRYSPLTTLTMNMLKQVSRELYQQEKHMAQIENINRQKNYFIIVMRMCITYCYLIENGKTCQQAVHFIKTYLKDRLELEIEKKYKDQTEFIELVKQKNNRDLEVLINALYLEQSSPLEVKKQLQKLYQQKSLSQHKKQLQKLTNLFIKYSGKTQLKMGQTTVAQKNMENHFQEEHSIISVQNMEDNIPDGKNELEPEDKIDLQLPQIPIIPYMQTENSLREFDLQFCQFFKEQDNLIYY